MKDFDRKTYNNITTVQEWINVLDNQDYDYHQINQAISEYKPGNPAFWKVAEITGDWTFDPDGVKDVKVSAADMFSPGTFGSEKLALEKSNFIFGYNRHGLDSVSEKIVNALELDNITADVNIQPPGGVKVVHYDTLCSLYADKNVDYSKIEFDTNLRIPAGLPPMHRMLVALSDWQPGWMFQLGTDQWVNWKKGDVIALDWRNAPHATANASLADRPLMKITASANHNWIDEMINTGQFKQIII